MTYEEKYMIDDFLNDIDVAKSQGRKWITYVFHLSRLEKFCTNELINLGYTVHFNKETKDYLIIWD